MNTKLDRLKEFADTARQVCLAAMDVRSSHATDMANIYLKALHAYRVELRRVRAEGDSK